MLQSTLSAPILLLLASCVAFPCHGFSSQRYYYDVLPSSVRYSGTSTSVQLSASPARKVILPPLIHPTTWRTPTTFLAACSDSSDAQDAMDEEQKRGMDEAFASLEALTPEDWDGNSSGSDTSSFDLKYSRTDDTPASDVGKSTAEEVELYLEMQGELEGTAVSSLQEEASVDEDLLQLELDEMSVEEDFGLQMEDNYPWTSINPILRLRGPVASGYGRGGKKLGVPTANLPASLFQSALEDVSNGVYFGWAVIEQQSPWGNRPIKAVVNVGYSPTFEGQENQEKIVEAHLITNSSPMEMNEAANTNDDSALDEDVVTEIEGDFYDETMRLQLIGYLRPEQKFDSFPELIAQIHRDIGNAHWALGEMPFIFSKEDEFVKHGVNWIGSGGGDVTASWEYESW